MGRPKLWNEETITSTAKKYKCYTKFRQEAPRAYSTALELGIIDQVTAHMERPASGPKQQLTLSKAKKIARPYKRRVDFSAAERSVYVLCIRYGWIDEVCKHMLPRGHRG